VLRTTTADMIYVDADEMASAIRTSGTYVMHANQITVQLWLEKDKTKSHVVVQDSSANPTTLARKIVTAMLEAGSSLKGQ